MAHPATFDTDPPFLLRHPRARSNRSFWSFLTGTRPEPPRVVLRRFEPVIDETPAVEPVKVALRVSESEPSLPTVSFEPVAVEPAVLEPVALEPVAVEPVALEPATFERAEIAAIELPDLPAVLREDLQAERLISAIVTIQLPALPASRTEEIEAERAEIMPEIAVEPEPPAVAPPFAAALPARRSWTRRIVVGMFSIAAHLGASLLLVAAGPVYLIMTGDRRDLVRWSNDLLDWVLQL